MKKILLLALGAFVFNSAQAQVPKKVSTSLVHKITATWCGPCGAWGWTLANDIIAATKDKSLYVSLYNDKGTSYNNNKFYSKTSEDLATQFTYGGWPSFGSNGVKRTGSPIYVSVIQADVTKAVDDFALITPVASSANSMTIVGNTITVDARVKFWSATTGDYYLAAYMIEDGALNLQNSQTGTVAHHDVMRGSMSSSSWGDLVATGSVAANATYSKTFTFNVTDATWDKTKFKVYTVLWKKVGLTYQYVNASENEAPTSINAIAGVNELKLIPNPSVGQSTVLSIQSTENQSLNINIVDMVGRSVFVANNTSLNVGQNNITIPSGEFVSGVYQVVISSEKGKIVEQLSVVK
jgi:hypothetical protein